MTFEEDRTIIGRVLAGDKLAFGALIDRHWAGVLAFARRMVIRTDAEDATQEAFLAAFLGLDKLRDHDRFHSWLLGIVANICRSRLRLLREGYCSDQIGGQAVPGFTLENLEPSPELIYETRELHLLISKAIATLPREQQEAVQLHYLRELKLSEIAILTGTPIGTLKARLHHARNRLRDSLLSSIVDAPLSGAKGEFEMIEVVVHDVVVRAPRNEVATWPVAFGDNSKLGLLRVILLKETAGQRILPIWVGPGEGDVIAMHLEHLATHRPTTFDLTTKLLALANTKIEKVAVTSLQGKTYFATMWINANGQGHEQVHQQVHQVDARPSDAIALALQAGAPIFVSPETFASTDFLLTPEHELSQLEEGQAKWVKEGIADPEPHPMEWKSVRSLPRQGAAEPPPPAKSD